MALSNMVVFLSTGERVRGWVDLDDAMGCLGYFCVHSSSGGAPDPARVHSAHVVMMMSPDEMARPSDG